MSVRYGILATLEAKPGRGDDLAAFLTKGRELAVAETGTVTWYAFKLSDTTYGIFDTFDDEAGRQAHLNGEIPAALGTGRRRPARRRAGHQDDRHRRGEVAGMKQSR